MVRNDKIHRNPGSELMFYILSKVGILQSRVGQLTPENELITLYKNAKEYIKKLPSHTYNGMVLEK